MPFSVIPSRIVVRDDGQAGIQCFKEFMTDLDPGFRRGDDFLRVPLFLKVSNFGDCFNGSTDMVLSIKRSDTHSNRPSNLSGAQLLVHQGCTVQPGAAGNIVVAI